jgi:hypothetical protein
MHSDFISGWDPEVLADLRAAAPKRSRRSEAGLSSAPSRSRPTLPHPYLDKYIPGRSLRMQGRLLTRITVVACLPGDNGCVCLDYT